MSFDNNNNYYLGWVAAKWDGVQTCWLRGFHFGRVSVGSIEGKKRLEIWIQRDVWWWRQTIRNDEEHPTHMLIPLFSLFVRGLYVDVAQSSC